MKKVVPILLLLIIVLGCSNSETTKPTETDLNNDLTQPDTPKETKITIAEKKALEQEQKREEKWGKIDEAVKGEDYSEAYRLVFRELNFRESEELQSVYNYFVAMEHFQNDNIDAGKMYLRKIANDYDGRYSAEIVSEKRKQFGSKYTSNFKSTEFPSIGMTAQEVLNSSWGKPRDKNITITANGESEQWVYGSGRYIYLEDGIVTTIQDQE